VSAAIDQFLQRRRLLSTSFSLEPTLPPQAEAFRRSISTMPNNRSPSHSLSSSQSDPGAVMPELTRQLLTLADTIDRLQRLVAPSPADLAKASVLERWRIDVTSNGLRLSDTLPRSGLPALLHDAPLCYIDPEGCWVHTTTRLYRLGRPATVRPFPRKRRQLADHRRIGAALVVAARRLPHDIDPRLAADVEEICWGWAAMPSAIEGMSSTARAASANRCCRITSGSWRAASLPASSDAEHQTKSRPGGRPST
jgi:Family of unknown function (DUF6634)